MTTRALSRRLERLEMRLIPATEERILILRFIAQDGEVVDKKEFKLSADPQPVKTKRRWW